MRVTDKALFPSSDRAREKEQQISFPEVCELFLLRQSPEQNASVPAETMIFKHCLIGYIRN
jgi:hypothetical protein